MIEPFKWSDGPESHLIPEPNPDAEWFFTQPSIARREYNGQLLLLTPGKKGYEGWQYQQPLEWCIGDNGRMWEWSPIYPKVGIFGQFLQSLRGKWAVRNSPYVHVQEFEDAELMFTEDYDYGEYWLLLDDLQLVPVDHAEQISNINELEIHTLDSVADVFDAVQKAMVPLRDNVYGVIFTCGLNKVRIRPSDFDWENYE